MNHGSEKTKTFFYLNDRNSKVVLDAKGTVIESSSESYPVGMTKAEKQLRACGWRLPKTVNQYDAWGRVVR